MKNILLCVVFLCVLTVSAHAAIVTEEVSYESGGVALTGYTAYDDSIDGLRPGVLVVHEWWGHNDYARSRARQLAKLGYVAFAVDMYGDGKVADHPDDAKNFMSEVSQNMDVAEARFLAALEILKKNQRVSKDNIGAIGYCFGGATVLNMARLGVDLKAVVSFHGSLASPLKAEMDMVKAKVMVCHGVDDSFVTEEQIESFKDEMSMARVHLRFIEYEGAVHSFTNPEADKFAEKFGMGVAYNEAADKKSWNDMQVFFDSTFNVESESEFKEIYEEIDNQ